MATTQANRTTFAFGVEPSANTEPSSTPAAFYGSPNSFPDFGPEPNRIARDPIGPSPMAEAGTAVSTTVRAGYEADLTHDNLTLGFLEGMLRAALSTTPRIFYPTSVRSTDYVVAANGALVENTLIIVRGCATAANNGLKVVGAGSDATHIVVSGLTAETFTSGQGVTIEVCGFQFAAGDAEIDADGNFKTTTKDLTELGIPAGQTVFIGDSSAAAYAFGTATHRGHARVSIAPAAHLITLDNKQSGKFPAAAADNGSGKTIRLFYGRTARIYATTHASYAERTYHIEVGHGTLSAGSAAYEYITGAVVTTGRLSLPAQAKATISVGFEGQGYVSPTASRRTSFSAPVAQNARTVLNTADHIRRGRIRLSTTDLTGYITALDLNIATGAQLQFAHGQQAPVTVTYGDIDITGTAQAFFSSMDLMGALQEDTPCNADWFWRCGPSASSTTDTWGVAIDIPALQLTTAPRAVSPNTPTMVSLNFKAVRDATYSTLMIVSDFPYLPAP